MKIEDLRAEIDETDDKIAELFVKRMRLAKEVAAVKAEEGLAVEDARREGEIAARVRGLMPSEVSPYGERLFETLFALSKEYQRAFLSKSEKSEQLMGARDSERDENEGTAYANFENGICRDGSVVSRKDASGGAAVVGQEDGNDR